MNRNICYHCGGEIRECNGRLECIHCGAYVEERNSSEEEMLLTAAYQKLRLADFSDAEQEFEDMIRRHPRNAQAYWGRLLAKYGIKYEDDYDGTKIPTCYATSMESVFESSDFWKAIEYADKENKKVFRRHAEYIERCRKEWVEQASREEPYDIFISYKESDKENGIDRTQDSMDMQDLYDYLRDEGYRVFFSRLSLRGKVGEKYEPYIFNALSTAKVMIVYGSKPEYINATWVKNEWTRYLKRIREGEKKQGSLLVAYNGFEPRELPSALSSLQCLDAAQSRFYPDLLSAIERILSENKPAAPKPTVNGPSCRHEVTFTSPEKAPTCTQPGLSEGEYCAECGAILKTPTVIPAKGHSFGEWRIAKKATCTEDGEYERVCHCGEKETQKIPSRGGHIPGDWVTVTEAAPGKEGLKVRKCVVCGEKLEEKTVPALPNGTASKGLAYKVNDDGKTCTVTGQGTCKDKNIVIPKTIDGYTVTGIVGARYGYNGFFVKSGFDKDIISVTIPNSVTDINDGAFFCCESLASVVIGNSVTSIGEYAFGKCKSLASVTIPNSVTGIGHDAFLGCVSLASVIIGNSVKNIDGFAFSGCTSLASVTVPNSVTSIGESAFFCCDGLSDFRYAGTREQWNRIRLDENWNEDSPIRDIRFEDSATHAPTQKGSQGLAYKVNDDGKTCTVIGQGTCKDRNIVIPEKIDGYTVTSIDGGAFFGCDRLPSVVIGNSVTSVGEYAFGMCLSLVSVTIPNSVTSIGKQAFENCKRLTDLRYAGTKREWKKISLDTYWRDGSAIRSVTCADGVIKGLFLH